MSDKLDETRKSWDVATHSHNAHKRDQAAFVKGVLVAVAVCPVGRNHRPTPRPPCVHCQIIQFSAEPGPRSFAWPCGNQRSTYGVFGRHKCLNCVVPLGGWHLRRTLREFSTHYHRERNHQGLGNELIDRPATHGTAGAIRRRQRVGGILSYYYRSAA